MSERTIQKGFSGGKLFVATVGGAVVGAAIGMLTAPRSGRETREWISKSANGAGAKVKGMKPALNAAYTAGSDAARDAYGEAMDSQESQSNHKSSTSRSSTSPSLSKSNTNSSGANAAK